MTHSTVRRAHTGRVDSTLTVPSPASATVGRGHTAHVDSTVAYRH